jgi:hypothetical protein
MRPKVRWTTKSFKQVLKYYLRRCFTTQPPPTRPFKIRTFPAGPPEGMCLDNVEELIDYLEGPDRK